ncbi:hypothetical protein KXS11_17610 [Plantibacter flavus]|uniref:hypothetical protein n=1 Tax=Plantibacter flavus TaxID=150123 RepID=UPI003F141D44
MTPTPSPSLLVEQIPTVAAAPWWGVPVVAGSFLLLGGVLTFLFTRWNERAKYERDRNREDTKELVEFGAQLVNAGNAARDLAMLGIGRSAAEFAPMVAKQGVKLMDDYQLAMTRFRLVYPAGMDDVLKEHATKTIAMLIPPYSDAGQEASVHEQRKATSRLVNALRALQGHSPIPNDLGGESTLVADALQAMDILIEEIRSESNAGKHGKRVP